MALRCCSTAARCGRRRGGCSPRRCGALAEALAAEWDAQEDKIDPATMPLTRLANSIIDGVAPSPGPVAAEIEQYLGTDLLFYRAPRPPAWSRASANTGTRSSNGRARRSARASCWPRA